MMLETKVAVMISCLLFYCCLFRGGQRRKASTSGGGQERKDPYGFRVILVGLESGLETFRDLGCQLRFTLRKSVESKI